MLKKWAIEKLFKIVLGLIILGVGVWYLSSSIGGASLSYTNMSTFMNQIDGNNTANTNGCFLCYYIGEMFAMIGNATDLFWTGIIKNLWILMAVGYGIFIIIHTVKYLRENATSKDIKDLTNNEPKLEFSKWFEKVWKTGLRVLIIGALLGAINFAAPNVLRIVTQIIVTPVMYLGVLLSMAATGVISGGHCDMVIATQNATDILTPVLQPFMCMMGNLNTVMLAGAGGGFALMNYSWMGLGGGVFTWLAGLALVLMFLVIGFDLFFQVLSVIFKLIFIIIFMPLLLAATAFEQVWSLAKTAVNSAIDILINSAVSIIKISLKITIIYAIVYFSADSFYPPRQDGFTSILPPLFGQITPQNNDAQTMSVMSVFTTCERVALVNNEIDKEKFKQCFITQRNVVEQKYPGAFDFMDDGFDFLLFMIGVWFLYFWVVSPKVDALLKKDEKEPFDYGEWLKNVGKTTYNAPGKIYNAVKEQLKQGK